MKVYNNTNPQEWPELLKRPAMSTADLEPAVRTTLESVRENGDKALLDLTERFDKVLLQNIQVEAEEFAAAEAAIDLELKNAIQQAQSNIFTFHQSQQETPEVIETMPGVQCWRKSVAIEKVGLYIPGGTAPLFSSVLMLGVPARIAGCAEIVLCTPPRKDGTIDPAILYTAQLVGINKVYKVGGAQAIAAMAYGTETVPAVYKIFGPGNQYVTEAKQQVNRVGVAIDLPAGPSEVMVVADQSAVPAFVAADLLSQAEHGADSQVVLIADTESLVNEILAEIEEQIKELPRRGFAKVALSNSVAIIAEDRKEMTALINEYAPEHLILAVENPERLAANIVNAGSVFLGNYTPESAGDYASGTNHTLPTNGFATAYSGVSLDSFVKKITFQRITPIGLQNIGPTVETMATAEQLVGHKNAVSIRLATIESAQDPMAEGIGNSANNEKDTNAVSVVEALVRTDLRAFKPYASARDEFEGQAEVYLDANENPFETDLNRYPDPLQKSLKKGIAAIKKVKPEHIFLGNGSDEAIDLLVRLFCETGTDSILTLPPTYGVYGVAARTAGVQVKELPLDANFQPDLTGLQSLSAQNAKLLFICNPNNPTGSIIPKPLLEQMIEGFKGIVVVDEAYMDFSDEDSCIEWIDRFPNLVVLQTFSKAWGLAGARLGMAFSNAEMISWLNKIKLPYNINQLTQQALQNKLENVDEVTAQIKLICQERDRLIPQLSELNFVQKVFPTQTNFILVRVNNPDQTYDYLMQKGIIVRNRSRQLHCEGCLRLTVGTPAENARLLIALRAFESSFVTS